MIFDNIISIHLNLVLALNIFFDIIQELTEYQYNI